VKGRVGPQEPGDGGVVVEGAVVGSDDEVEQQVRRSRFRTRCAASPTAV
jgi:hypothetical protein